MSKLFEATMIDSMRLPNRFVRSATWEGLAGSDGSVTPALIETMKELARGGIGLIISSHAYVTQEGQATPWQIGIYKDELVPGLREMTDSVHDLGGRIVMQLAHAGTFAAEKLIGKPPLAVSDFEGLATSPRREMTAGDIDELVAAFAAAAARAKDAGFDGVQIHSAHGYLLSQFLSPIYNRRTDDYGGSIENRARAHVRVVRAIREAVGDGYPVLIKMNCRDFKENGLSLEDSVQAACLVVEAGVNAIEVSGGLLTGGKMSPSRPGIDSEEKEAYFREELRAFRKALHIPLILVGGIRSYSIAEQIVDEGTADFISMSRPLIREPSLINRWKAGDRGKAGCLSDNLCFKPGFEGKGICCVPLKRDKSRNAIPG
jgi:2,4-dienoyl-CoA reductase-like NADH-dependent reductase (Old Yellow Enzyme family)